MPRQISPSSRFSKNRFSNAEKFAYQLLSVDWDITSVAAEAEGLFRRQQPWVVGLIEELFRTFVDRPTLQTLVDYLDSSPLFQSSLVVREVERSIRRIWIGHPSLNWLDWDLPRIENPGQLASHLGVTPRGLLWLTGIGRPLELRTEHYVRTWIRKRGYGERLIESPKPLLKSVQRIILQDILSRVPVHHAAHGFCVGRSVLGFVDPHLSNPVCLRMDLKDFFPSIASKRVRGLFRTLGYGTDVARNLAALCTTRTAVCRETTQATERRRSLEAAQLYSRFHLPQGAPTSPSIANLIAHRLDCRLSGLADAASVVYTRYADDLLFSGPRDFGRSAKRFLETVGAIAIEEGFEVNFRKTRIEYASQRQLAGGIVINEKKNMRRQDYDRLKAILFNCVRFGPASQNRERHSSFRESLLGQVNWVKQLNAVKGEKLMSIFRKIDWET